MDPCDIQEAFQGAATVGERGQVVIPASVREQLNIEPGQKLLVFAHPSGMGVMFLKLDVLQRLSEALGPLVEIAVDSTATGVEADDHTQVAH